MIFLQTLGTARITAGPAVVTPTAVRTFALLLRLAADAGGLVSRKHLRDAIFPESTERDAGHSLRQLIYEFRKNGIPLHADPHCVSLDPSDVRSDYSDLIRTGVLIPELARSIEGGLLPDYAPNLSKSFDEWLADFKRRTAAELGRALLRELSRSRHGGDWAAAERAARACLALDPLNEEATLTLAEMLALGGSKVQALDLLDAYMQKAGERSPHLRIPASILRRRILA